MWPMIPGTINSWNTSDVFCCAEERQHSAMLITKSCPTGFHHFSPSADTGFENRQSQLARRAASGAEIKIFATAI
jgi:hypothetical protein